MPEFGMAGDTSSAEGLSRLRRVCVYCGSGVGANPAFAEAAQDLGRELAGAGIGLVYGGGDVGLMGIVARTVLESGGHVTGIIPDFLRRREHLLKEVQETMVVPDMHSRKQLMFEKADAFVALPGGVGTLEELIEQMTWAQLGRHAKPILLLDVDDFWQPLFALLSHMRVNGFIRPGLELNYFVASRAEDVVPILSEAVSKRAEPSRNEFVQQHF